MIDAAIEAIARATGVRGTVLDFKVSSVTGGGDALGDVVVPARGRRHQGVGPRCRHRRRRGIGPGVPRGGQQDRAAARASRPARGRRRRSLTRRGATARSAPSQTGLERVARDPVASPAVPLIEGKALTKRSATSSRSTASTSEVEPGEAFGFLGPNGAGKTSTMRMIGCVSPPSGGELRVLGLDPRADGPDDPGPARRRCRRRTASTPS